MFGQPFGLEVDMWSLGCVLAELYHGQSLFFAKDKIGVLQKVGRHSQSDVIFNTNIFTFILVVKYLMLRRTKKVLKLPTCSICYRLQVLFLLMPSGPCIYEYCQGTSLVLSDTTLISPLLFLMYLLKKF